MHFPRTLLLLSALGFSSLGWADTIENLLTGHTGAQTQLDTNHSSYFLAPSLVGGFTCPVANCTVAGIGDFDDPAQSYYISGGVFSMKVGPSTSANIILTLYQDGSNVAQVNFTKAQFCNAHVGSNCQSFQPTVFQFATNYLVTPNHVYYAALTSTAVDTQSTAYFIKNANVAEVNYQGDPNKPVQPYDPEGPPSDPPPPFAPESSAAVPEPGTWMMLAGGLGLVALGRFRRTSR